MYLYLISIIAKQCLNCQLDTEICTCEPANETIKMNCMSNRTNINMINFKNLALDSNYTSSFINLQIKNKNISRLTGIGNNFTNLIKTLDISANNIKEIGSFSSNFFASLTVFYLKNNFLTNITRNVFINLTNLEIFNVVSGVAKKSNNFNNSANNFMLNNYKLKKKYFTH
jgi:hypothetical protein